MAESRSDHVGMRGTKDSRRPEVLTSPTDKQVLSAIVESGDPISRAEVADRTGLSKPTVSAATARLLRLGLLRDVGVRGGRRGGVATLYELNTDAGRSLAVIIQNDLITVQARDLGGVVRAQAQAEVPDADSPERTVALANSLLADVAAQYAAPLRAAAVSIADPVDVASGLPVERDRSVFPAAAFRPSLDLDLDRAERLVVDNDVNWAAIGEFRQGELAGCRDFVYVYVGQGLGAGLLLDGQVYRGHRGMAGEVGYLRDGSHTELDITQRLAALGLGTSQRYGLDVERASAILSTTPLTPQAREAADVLALAVANLAVVVNPRAIAFGGPLSVHTAFAEALQERIAALCIDPPTFVRSTSTPLLGAQLEAHRLAGEVIGLTS